VTWGFLWIMLALKIPLIALLWIVWWAVRAEPETEQRPNGDDGGTKRPRHPRRPFPRRPRRGPHGDPLPSSPPRVRTTVARARLLEH
jgi:hypothetical protein